VDSRSIRRTYTDFFEERGHLPVPSASLVPAAFDPSVLLTTAGMQPFKPYFLGEQTPPAVRLTSVQKCFRTTDIDEVGNTARHLTFFQMMGNFSFGDYFKQGAIEMAFELSTKVYGLDPTRIWATIYRGDESLEQDTVARDLWLQTGVPAERIVALGGDNFWASGPTGPCGPCSELYWDWGPQIGCGRPECAPGCDCDRFLEYWNLVFMQYDRDAASKLTPLPMQNIDTGSGVERVAAVLQNVLSVYETDGFQEIIQAIEGWTGTAYTNEGVERKALRVLADHGRAMTMLATDGVMPSNEGRGYILRRIIRRAVQHGSRIGLETPFLSRLHEVVIGTLDDAYPELAEHRDDVRRLLEAEEERFSRTLQTGSRLLDEVIARTRAEGLATVPAEDAFRLHDTYGFPIEVTAEIAEEAGLGIDEAGFGSLMRGQRERARAAARRGDGADAERLAAFVRGAGFRTEFRGYDTLDLETQVGAFEDLGDGRALVKLRESPFYPEGGGQVSDGGTLESAGARAAVEAVHRFDGDQALTVRVEHGELHRGEPVRARVERALRVPTVANHTGTHLLHRALRNVLGEHVRQAGSAVRPDKLRFDFTHDRPMEPDQLQRVEDEVNRLVAEVRPVRWFEVPIDEARRLGATMLFGEKYGDIVRVVEIDGYSRELCGGTHAHTTAEVGPFRVLRESSVAQGVRRIEAVTGRAALDLLRANDRAAEEAARLARTTPGELPATVTALQQKVRELEKAARSGGRDGADVASLTAAAVVRGDGVKVLAVEAPPGTGGDDLLQLTDRLKGQLGPSAVVVGARDDDGKAQIVANFSPEAVDAGLSAVDVIKAVGPTVQGGGGGRPAMARAGGKDSSRLAEALDQARALLTA
jgi:alanyl-tRNA synthetase